MAQLPARTGRIRRLRQRGRDRAGTSWSKRSSAGSRRSAGAECATSVGPTSNSGCNSPPPTISPDSGSLNRPPRRSSASRTAAKVRSNPPTTSAPSDSVRCAPPPEPRVLRDAVHKVASSAARESSRANRNSKVLDFVQSGGPSGARTQDLRIKSPLLCQTELRAQSQSTAARPDPTPQSVSSRPKRAFWETLRERRG